MRWIPAAAAATAVTSTTGTDPDTPTTAGAGTANTANATTTGARVIQDKAIAAGSRPGHARHSRNGIRAIRHHARWQRHPHFGNTHDRLLNANGYAGTSTSTGRRPNAGSARPRGSGRPPPRDRTIRPERGQRHHANAHHSWSGQASGHAHRRQRTRHGV